MPCHACLLACNRSIAASLPSSLSRPRSGGAPNLLPSPNPVTATSTRYHARFPRFHLSLVAISYILLVWSGRVPVLGVGSLRADSGRRGGYGTGAGTNPGIVSAAVVNWVLCRLLHLYPMSIPGASIVVRPGTRR
ncbi:hypothetical protein KC19_9G189600 [Ceratodon purpureus]|uniref:Uncharacterized protein n=1 Tax=Ceratodon purpureus TaxID=3225 RepID=A0A8T0GXL1_CERPU|nr:hypothetical protein KC19_9G189600 [Ceratodon purpureus]